MPNGTHTPYRAESPGPTMNAILAQTPAFAALRRRVEEMQEELVECKSAVARVDGQAEMIAQAINRRMRQLEDRLKEVTEKRIGQEAMQAYQ